MITPRTPAEAGITHIPHGPATKAGAGATALFAVIAAYSAIQKGDHTPETITGLVLAASTLVTIMLGKYAQAAALYRNASPARSFVYTSGGGGGGSGGGSSVTLHPGGTVGTAGSAANVMWAGGTTTEQSLADPLLDSPHESTISSNDLPSDKDHPR